MYANNYKYEGIHYLKDFDVLLMPVGDFALSCYGSAKSSWKSRGLRVLLTPSYRACDRIQGEMKTESSCQTLRLETSAESLKGISGVLDYLGTEELSPGHKGRHCGSLGTVCSG